MKIFEALMQAGGSAVELRMYGHIGSTMLEEGITAKQVAAALAAAPDCTQVNVKLSSPGGAVFEGMAIRSMLSAHPAHVVVDIEGLAASAGSVLAMAGDVIRMHDGASMMLHEGRANTAGDIASHKRAIQALETINDGAASVYAQRSGMTKEKVLQLMATETWLTPQQAKEMGLVDEVVAGKTAAPRMHFDLGRYGYQHVPPQIAAAMKETPMSNALIAMALGLSEQAEDSAVTAAIASLQRSAAARETMLTELRQVTGKQNEQEILGAVRGLSAAAGKLAEATSEIEKRDALLEAQAHAAVIEADKRDPKGRKLTPAMEPWAKTQSAEALRAFLEVAPHSLRMAAAPGEGKTAGQQPSVVTEGSHPAVTHNGKSWEELKPIEKHNLRIQDEATYTALHEDFLTRKRAS